MIAAMETVEQPLSNLAKCPISAIEIGANRHRGLIEGSVKELMESIALVGLLNPIAVIKTAGDKATLVAGLHRLEACRRLGWSEIPVVPLTVDALGAELVEIDENLRRTDLPYADKLRLVNRRAQIAALIKPGQVVDAAGETQEAVAHCAPPLPENKQARRGRGEKTGPDAGSTRDKAKKTGTSRRTIQRAQRAVDAIGDETLGKLSGTSLDSAREIDALTKTPEAERRNLIDAAIAGQQITARKKPPKPEPVRGDGSTDYRPRALKEFVAWRAKWGTTIPELKKFDRTFTSVEHALKGHHS